MITSNTPSISGSTQTTATSHNQFSSFSNQPSSHYPTPPNLLLYNTFPPYFLPVQQPVLPPFYSHAYLSSYPNTLQQWNEPTCVHVPSDFTSLLPNPVHLNQQYSVLPSHTNTLVLHQNSSLSHEPHPLHPLTDGPPHFYHRQRSRLLPLFSSTDPNSVTTAAATATAHHSLNPPDVHSLPSQFLSITTSRKTPQLAQSDSTRQPSSSPYHTEQSSHQQSFPHHHPRQSYTSNCDSTITAYHSLAPHSPPATTFSGVTAAPLTPAHQHPLSHAMQLSPPQHAQSDSTRQPSSSPYHSEQSSHQQSFPSYHPKQSYASNCDSTITAYHSLVPHSPPATTPSGVTASISAPVNHLLSPAMQRYVSYLKNVYKNKTTPVYDKEHSLLQVKAKSFINIALVHKDSPQYGNNSVRNEMIMDRLHGHVDAIQRKKTKLFIRDVCKNQKGDLARSVLVEGAPGVGKTTFAYELCKRWARGEVLWECAAVILIKLRDYTTRTAQNMYDLLYHPRPEVRQAVVDELIDHDGEYILLILDGYDELTNSQKKSTSVIQRIMSKELLVQSNLMVTSRPLATRTLHDNFVQSIDQHIEVLGFTEKNIEEYIQSACGDKPELEEDFKSYLSSHPFSSALMFNPLQCAIVTDLYRSHWECGEKGFAPKTLTELYTGLVHIMLVRYLTQHRVYKHRDWWIKDLSDLPKKVSRQLKVVTKLAAEGINNQQYVFDEVNTNIPSETLGLMLKEEIVASGIGISASHIFLHLTLQEYLAAVNYSQQYSSPERLSQFLTKNYLFPLKHFLQYYGKERKQTEYFSATHWPVVLFVAGRTKLSGVPINIFKIGLHDSDDDDVITTVEVPLLHLLYETQSPQLIQSTLVTSRKYLYASGSSALDWFVIGYCIANSTSKWRVIKKSNDSVKYFDQLVMGLHLGTEECSGECKIGSLLISGHWTGNLNILLNINLQSYAKLVTEIKLVGDYEEQSEQHDSKKNKTKSVNTSACYPMLESLTIDNVESSHSSTLLSFISQHSNLVMLSLKKCNLSSTATSSFVHFLQSPNNRLHKLTLDDCTIQIPYTSKFDVGDSLAIYYYQLKLTSHTDTANFSLEITGFWYAVSYILSQPHLFYANTLTNLKVVIDRESIDLLQIDASLYPNLERFDITSSKEDNHTFPALVSSQQNSHRILTLNRYYLNCDIVRSLIHSLQSSHCGLQVTLDDCISDHTHTTTTSSKLKLKSLDSGNVSLEFTGDFCDFSHWLSQLPYYTQLSELILHLKRPDSTKKDTLQEIISFLHILESLKIDSIEFIYLSPSIPQFIGTQPNNLHTLSLSRFNLSSDVTTSLIHSLQSPLCRLHKLTMDKCAISTPKKAQQNTLYIKNNTTLCSLVTTDSLCVLNHILSNVVFTQMTELSLCITTDNSLAAEVLTKIPVSSTVETIKIDSMICLSLPLSIPKLIRSQQNNLYNLSLKSFNFSSDVTRLFIQSLKSPHCILHQLLLKSCTITTPDENTISTKNNTTLCSLVTTNSLCVLNHILSNVIFTQMTELSLFFTTHDSSIAEVLTKILVSCPVLKTIKIDSSTSVNLFLPLSITQLIGSKQNNLHTLSMRCTLSSNVTRSLIHSLQSPHCKLCKLALSRCKTSTPDDENTIYIKNNTTLCSLVATDSLCVLNHILSNVLFTQMTDLSLCITTHDSSEAVEVLTKIPFSCPVLETIKIDSSYCLFLPLSFTDLMGSKQNNLHTLSLGWCTLSSDVTRSLIHSLQSPHCKLYKLALYDCTIHFTTNHTQLTTAIVSSTTITHLLFIDRYINTPSLTALASGLKHNTTIEQLAVDMSKNVEKFNKDQFRVLIDAVDSSAVKNLCMYNHSDYKQWFNNCTLSRNNVDIEWYSNYDDLYNKW